MRERGRRSFGVSFVCPVVLTTQCRPAKFLVQQWGDGEGFVNSWV
jgi:hypothetical protein